MKTNPRFAQCLAGLLLFLPAIEADTLYISLDSFSLSGAPGTSVTFTGTVQNSSGEEVFLNGAGGSLSYSELTLDLTPFFTFTPLSIPDGQSYDGPLFAVAISNVALPGDYPGTFTIQGGPDSSAFDTVGTADFEVTVSPEPSSGSLLGMILLILGAIRFLRARLSFADSPGRE